MSPSQDWIDEISSLFQKYGTETAELREEVGGLQAALASIGSLIIKICPGDVKPSEVVADVANRLIVEAIGSRQRIKELETEIETLKNGKQLQAVQ